MNSHSILPASCTSSCLMLMIWSRPRAEQITRSCRLVLLRPHRSLRCGDRIMLLDSRESRKRICKLPGLRHGNLAISSQQSRQKTTLAQWVRNSSRATLYNRYCVVEENSSWPCGLALTERGAQTWPDKLAACRAILDGMRYDLKAQCVNRPVPSCGLGAYRFCERVPTILRPSRPRTSERPKRSR